jgi:hypothetical protein
MKARNLLAAAGVLAALAGPALAAAPADKKAADEHCFFHFWWDSWHAPDDKTILMRVNVKEYYRLDLAGRSLILTDPTAHLISRITGPTTICSPLDLDLKVSDGHSIDPLFPKSLTKLTPEQVALIPKRDLP